MVFRFFHFSPVFFKNFDFESPVFSFSRRFSPVTGRYLHHWHVGKLVGQPRRCELIHGRVRHMWRVFQRHSDLKQNVMFHFHIEMLVYIFVKISSQTEKAEFRMGEFLYHQKRVFPILRKNGKQCTYQWIRTKKSKRGVNISFLNAPKAKIFKAIVTDIGNYSSWVLEIFHCFQAKSFSATTCVPRNILQWCLPIADTINF